MFATGRTGATAGDEAGAVRTGRTASVSLLVSLASGDFASVAASEVSVRLAWEAIERAQRVARTSRTPVAMVAWATASTRALDENTESRTVSDVVRASAVRSRATWAATVCCTVCIVGGGACTWAATAADAGRGIGRATTERAAAPPRSALSKGCACSALLGLTAESLRLSKVAHIVLLGRHT